MKEMPGKMNDVDLARALRRMAPETGSLHCLGCGYEHKCSLKGCAIIRLAVDRLEELPLPVLDGPLSLEQLRVMDGEPVYLDFGSGGEWALVRVQQGKVFITHKNAICTPANILLECGGKACRRRPEEGTK